jgi:hypothetical protein
MVGKWLIAQKIVPVDRNTFGWLLLKNVAGANDGRATLAAAAPFTWATGDIIDAGLVYQAA